MSFPVSRKSVATDCNKGSLKVYFYKMENALPVEKTSRNWTKMVSTSQKISFH